MSTRIPSGSARRSTSASRRRATAVAAVAAVAVLGSGCAAPDTMLREADKQHRTMSRGIADIVDAADRAFGEARVEDRERLVRATLGGRVGGRTNDGVSYTVPVSLLAPLPALQRRANLFFQFDSETETSSGLGGALPDINDNKTLALGYLSKLADLFDAGVRAEVRGSGGGWVGLRPFLRYEYRPDPWRFYVEQQVYYRTNEKFGERTSIQVNRLLAKESFLRVATVAEYKETVAGLAMNHRLIYRRPLVWDTYLSSELGISHNTHRGPPKRSAEIDPGLSLEEQDSDEAFAAMSLTGKLLLPWVEWELNPGVHYVWSHGKPWEYSVTCNIRFLFEAYLRGGKKSAPTPPGGEAPLQKPAP